VVVAAAEPCEAITFGGRCELRKHAPDVPHCGRGLRFGGDGFDVIVWTDALDARELARGDWGPAEDVARATYAATIRGRVRVACTPLAVCPVAYETVPLIP
jgi:hypothetical protein